MDTDCYTKWDKFELPPLTEDAHYGFKWPRGTPLIAKELGAFKALRMGKGNKYCHSAFTHFLNIQRLLFPNCIELYKKVPRGIVWNNYYLEVVKKCCEFKKTALTGPASANKTFGAASFGITSFFCAPKETMVMVSTTSGSASERRIWGDIKKFHKMALYEECGIEKIGECVDHLKAIVFDEGKQLYDATRNERDMRDGIQVIPIATDQTGDKALDTIQGTKNKFVLWILDEMAQMQDGVTRPNGNLVQNPHYQFIGIANANDENDPHGKVCMPQGGLEALNVDTDREWVSAKGYNVLFLHGDETPNNHPYVDQDSIEKVTDFPFPYASNRLNSNESAIEYGNGNIEDGKETLDYWKFSRGFWAPKGASSSLYTTNLFKSFNSVNPPPLIVSGHRTFAGGDFAFTTGGDSNSLCYAVFGFDAHGRKVINFCKESISIRINAQSKDEFIKATAIRYIEKLRELNVNFEDFRGDIGNDGGLTMLEMGRVGRTHALVGISSSGAAVNKKKYKNKVTELWFNARDLIRTGLCRGINLQSKYADQLCKRKYNSFGKNLYQLETKPEMKKRIGRSPDDADGWVYLCNAIISSGVVDNEIAKVRAIRDAEDEVIEAHERKSEVESFFNRRGEDSEFQLNDNMDYDDEEYSMA